MPYRMSPAEHSAVARQVVRYLVQRAAQTLYKGIDLVYRNHIGWTQCNGVAHIADDQATFQAGALHLSAHARSALESLAAPPVRHQFYARDETYAANVPHQGMIAERVRKPRLQLLAEAPRDLDYIHLLVDPQCLDGDGGRNGMAGIGEAVAQHPKAIRFVGDDLVDGITDGDGRDRHVARSQTLRDRQHVRLEAESLAAEPVAGAREAANHFVRQQQDVMPAQHGLDFREVIGGGHRYAACGHHGLRDHGGDRFRTLAQGEGLKLFGEPGREISIAFA